ncbi:RNA-directed DNA polymerase, eukaryota, reverse transcriptase zinc-binding domain protein, partial [Tanacetum coccineum]
GDAKVWRLGVDALEEGEELKCDPSTYNSIGCHCLRPDGAKKAYVKLTPDYDNLDVADKIGITRERNFCEPWKSNPDSRWEPYTIIRDYVGWCRCGGAGLPGKLNYEGNDEFIGREEQRRGGIAGILDKYRHDSTITLLARGLKSGSNQSIPGSTRYERDRVADQFVKHFEAFLGTTKHEMVKEISDKEVKEALFDIDGDKASRPDGFSSEFFKKAWDVSTTNKVSELRPIACYNVLCKCISKIMKNKIKCGMDKIVHINQSAFIPGRHIQDNILIAQELLRGYNRRNGPRRCAMQIDIQKAYDTVNWIFIENILIRFHNTMVKRIMQCITSSKFSICLNGGIQGYFKGGRGLGEGDHISPYLFTLVMKVFNLIMIKNIIRCKEFGYHFGCKELKLSHICFADYLLVLCKGNKESLQVIKQSLDEFSQVSRLTANLGKSVIFFGGIKEEERKDLLQILPFKCGKLPVRYLGVPLLAKRLSVQDCKMLIDIVESKINCWRNKILSYVGRIQLIASVLSSMQLYWASIYLLPNTVINDLDKLFKRFLLNAGDSARGKARILKNKKSLWAEWVNVVKLKNRNVQMDSSDSWGWKTMLSIRDKIKNNVIYEIGKGNSVSVWYDKWNVNGPLGNFITQRNIYDAKLALDAKISEMINDNNWKWPIEWFSKFPELQCISNPPNLTDKEDRVL